MIITVILLVILATVTINAVFDSGIIWQASNGTQNYVSAEKTENDIIGNTASIMQEYIDGTYSSGSTTTWEYDTDGNVTNGTITLAIGSYVNYDPGTYDYTSETDKSGYTSNQYFNTSSYSYGWRVLGVENGQILLISEELIGPDSGGSTNSTSGRTTYVLSGQAGYVNCESELEAICSIYGHGTGATKARSITVDDINNITGYDPETAKHDDGAVNEYGNAVTYTLKDSIVYYKGTKYPIDSTPSSLSSFTYYTGSAWKTLEDGDDITIISDYYYYYPNTLTTSSSGNTEGISTDSEIYKLLFTNSSRGAYLNGVGSVTACQYWLKNSSFATYEGMVDYACRSVGNGIIWGMDLFYTNGGCEIRTDYGIRPIVYLQANIDFTGDNTSGWEISV